MSDRTAEVLAEVEEIIDGEAERLLMAGLATVMGRVSALIDRAEATGEPVTGAMRANLADLAAGLEALRVNLDSLP